MLERGNREPVKFPVLQAKLELHLSSGEDLEVSFTPTGLCNYAHNFEIPTSDIYSKNTIANHTITYTVLILKPFLLPKSFI